MRAALHEVPEVLLESFARNAEVNAALIHHLSDAEWALSDGQGGMSVIEQLAHMAGFRKDWLNQVAPAHAQAIAAELGPDDMLLSRDPGELAQALREGDAAVLGAVQEALQAGRAFEGAYRSHPAHFLQHTLVHDAHHRGQVMTLLRQGGRPPEQMAALERVTWPVWRQ